MQNLMHLVTGDRLLPDVRGVNRGTTEREVVSGHHFVIGSSHKVCEDYAASRMAFAALSDGCSVVRNTQGRRFEAHTDVGSRLLVHSAIQQWLGGVRDSNEFVRQSVSSADVYRSAMRLPRDTLSATLLWLIDDGSAMNGRIVGDGVLACRNRDTKTWSHACYEFDPVPFYPRHISDRRPDTTPKVIGVNADLYVSHEYGYPMGKCRALKATNDLIVGISDGAFSFTQDGKPVAFKSIAGRLLDFRRMKGEFMVRHLNGVLRELAEDGIVNQDDISMVALYSK